MNKIFSFWRPSTQLLGLPGKHVFVWNWEQNYSHTLLCGLELLRNVLLPRKSVSTLLTIEIQPNGFHSVVQVCSALSSLKCSTRLWQIPQCLSGLSLPWSWGSHETIACLYCGLCHFPFTLFEFLSLGELPENPHVSNNTVLSKALTKTLSSILWN